MFERFTDRARRVLVLAQEEAVALQHSFLGTEHILLGLVHEGEGVGAKALQEIGIGLEAARDRVVAQIGRGAEPVKDKKVPFTPRAKKVLEFSLREALQLGHNYIGTEHLLLGLLREGEGVGGQVLRDMGADEGALRQKVIDLLAGYAAPSKVPTEEELPFRFSGPARRVLPRANDLAHRAAVSTEHLLLALVAEENGLAAKALAALGVTPEQLTSKFGELRREGHRDSDTQQVEIAPGITLNVEHAGFDAAMLKDVVRDAIFGRLQQEATGDGDTTSEESPEGGGS